MGLLAAHCAFARGAQRVILIDREEERLAFARERIRNGTVETINFTSGGGASSVGTGWLRRGAEQFLPPPCR